MYRSLIFIFFALSLTACGGGGNDSLLGNNGSSSSSTGGGASSSGGNNSSGSTTGSAMLSWTPPTRNTDGSALTDLAGYKIYYGTSSRSYSNVITINTPGVVDYLVENLTPDTWYFAISAFNSTTDESGKSGEVIKIIE